MASERSGRSLDAVEADRYWGRLAVRERLANPWETLRLVLWRGALLFWNAELTLDHGPRQDPNPLRWLAPLPFAAVLGLAAAGIAIVGFGRTGGWGVWGAVLACAVTPLVFFVSSRYRLPMVSVLCLPAGAGLAALVLPSFGITPRRRVVGAIVLLGVIAGSLSPSLSARGRDLLAQADGAGFLNRGRAWLRNGDLERAEADLRQANERHPGWSPAQYELGRLLAGTGRIDEAETYLRLSLANEPKYANAACALGRLLNRTGRHSEALPLLRSGLESEPRHPVCREGLVVALSAAEGENGGGGP